MLFSILAILRQKGIIIKLDDKSISNFYDSLFRKEIKDGSYNIETKINPICGSYYKKFKLKIEVAFIDTISQRTPLFLDCKQFDKYIRENKGQTYQVKPLPTYIITKFFTWEEL